MTIRNDPAVIHEAINLQKLTKNTMQELNILAENALKKVSIPGKEWKLIDQKDQSLYIGQLVYLPVPYEDETLKIVERCKDSNGMIISSFRAPNRQKDFRSRLGKLDLAGAALGDTEEIFASRGKMRPCIVVSHLKSDVASYLPDPGEKRQAETTFPQTYMLAPLYSCYPSANTSFGPIVTLLAKCFIFPEFLHLSASDPKSPLQNDSILRLDKAFSSQLKFSTELRPARLSPDRVSLLRHKMAELYKDGKSEGDEYYEKIKSSMKKQIPSGFF